MFIRNMKAFISHEHVRTHLCEMRLHRQIVNFLVIRPIEEVNFHVNRKRRLLPVLIVQRAIFKHQLGIEKISQGNCRPQQTDHQGKQEYTGAASREPVFLSWH